MLSTVSVVCISIVSAIVCILLGFLVYKLCRNKQSSKRINTSLRRREKENRISANSFTKTTQDELYSINVPEPTHKSPRQSPPRVIVASPEHHVLNHRVSEPTLQTKKHFTDNEDTRPNSDVPRTHEVHKRVAFSHGVSAVDIRPGMSLKTPKADHDTVRINSDSALETKFRRSHVHRDKTACLSSQSEDSGIAKDIPAWSMESLEYQTSSTTSLGDSTRL